jgi:hypothetical protein
MRRNNLDLVGRGEADSLEGVARDDLAAEQPSGAFRGDRLHLGTGQRFALGSHRQDVALHVEVDASPGGEGAAARSLFRSSSCPM